MKAVIFDIDGTLADNSERQKYLSELRWDMFFNEMGNDYPVKEVLELYNLIKNSQQYKMIIVSGRPEKYKKLTEQWLTWNNIYYDDLYMRKDGDQRKDNVIKQEILKHIKEKYEISFAFDDRKSVVDMWRENGVFCFQSSSLRLTYPQHDEETSILFRIVLLLII